MALFLLKFLSGSLLAAMGDACGGIFAAGQGFLADSNWNYLLAVVIFAVFLSQLTFLVGGGYILFRASHWEKQRRKGSTLSCPALRSIICEKYTEHIYFMPGNEQLDAVTVGLIRPRIVLSEGLVKALQGRELVAVAAHEEAHRAARDNLLIAAAKSVTTTLFYLPGPKLAFAQMRNCLERAADRSAASGSGDRFAIAEALTRIAAMNYSETGSTSSSTVTALSGSGDLSVRIEELVGDDRYSGRGWRQLALLVMGTAFAIGMFASSALAVSGSDQREAFICYTQHTQSTGPDEVCQLDHPSH